MNCKDVLSPSACVHAIPRGVGGGDMIHQLGEGVTLDKFGAFEGRGQSPTFKPSQLKGPTTVYIIPRQLPADIHG